MAKFTLETPKSKARDKAEPDVDPNALAAFAAGAKERRGASSEQPPWDKYDPDAPPRYNVSVRLNDYQLEMLRYLSKVLDTSQQKILRKHLLPAIEEMATKEFETR